MRPWNDLAQLAHGAVGPEAIVAVCQLQIAAQRHALFEGAADPYPLPRRTRRRRDAARAAREPLPAELQHPWQDQQVMEATL